MSRTQRYIDSLVAAGRHHFTTEEAVAALGGTIPAVRAALHRLKAKGAIADPHRGFHVVVPPEYRRLGCLPPEHFVPQLMQHLAEPYYVALLSAAELHGAAHQRPQAFQVMVPKNRRALKCGMVRVQFVARKDMRRTTVLEKKTPRGPLRVASAESTALELVGYADQCGGLDNVASVLDELVEALDAKRLADESTKTPIAWTQRLGYLLDLTNHRDLADGLTARVSARAKVIAPLVRSTKRVGSKRDARWKLAVNANVEPDL